MRIRTALLAVAAAIVFANGVSTASTKAAEPTWTQQSPAMSPPARFAASMAYDPATEELVLFGGLGKGSIRLGDTWTYDGTTWTQRFPATSPLPRYGASMAYDPATGELVLFGGSHNSGELADTWVYDGTTWSQKFPTTSPPGRSYPSMAYDPATGELVLFGGYGGGYKADTWTYDGTTWTQRFPAISPPGRSRPSMAYSPTTGEILLFGGDHHFPLFADTWTYDGTIWTQRFPVTSPPARYGAPMVYYPVTDELVLFGGYGDVFAGGGAELNDTWTSDGATWTRRFPATSPPARDLASMAYYPVTDELVLFGGLGLGPSDSSPYFADTWTYTAAKATPSLSTQASPDIRRGKAIRDRAFLSAGNSPRGQILFRLYRPRDASCSRAPVFSDAVSVSGNGTYESASFTAKAPGIYRWVASYAGDANNEAVSGSCNDPGESVRVSPPCRRSRRAASVFRRSQLPPGKVCRRVLAQ